MSGTFECKPITDKTTRLTHAYEVTSRRPFRFFERRMPVPLSREINEEVARLFEILGREAVDA